MNETKKMKKGIMYTGGERKKRHSIRAYPVNVAKLLSLGHSLQTAVDLGTRIIICGEEEQNEDV